MRKDKENEVPKPQNNDHEYITDFADAFNIILTAYGYIINLYPIYDKLEPSIRSPRVLMIACTLALLFTAFVYTAFGWLAAEVFGIQNLKQNIFSNFEGHEDLLSQAVKILFLVMFVCAIPFNVHPTKLCFLNIIEEARNGSVSKMLD